MSKNYFQITQLILFLMSVASCGQAQPGTSAPVLPTATSEYLLPTATSAPTLPTATTEPTLIIPTLTLSSIPVFEEAECAFEVPVGFSPECGYLIVPEDRSQPTGQKIRLHVAIFRSTNPNPAPDPLIHLIGGPGSSALQNVRWILRGGGTRILEQRDYILFDQRGTQYSNPYLYCLPYDQYLWDAHELDISLDEYNAGALPILETCLEDWRKQGLNLAAYNNAENAADVHDLQKALGYEQVNLYGTSYGSRLALTVLRDHPAGIRSVILDSVAPPQINLDLELAFLADRSLQEVFNACAEDDHCTNSYGDIEAKFFAVVERLEAAPVQIETNGPYRPEPYKVFLDGDLFIDAIFLALYSVVSIADIPRFIHLAYEESYAELSEPAGGAIGMPGSTGLFWSVTCRDEVPFEIEAPALPGSEYLPTVLREHFTEKYTLDVCELWDIPPAGMIENEAVVSSIPTLLFSGRYDPITPGIFAELAAQTLDTHFYYEFPNRSHGVMRSESCALQMGLAFLNDPTRPPDASCMNDLVKIKFR